MSFASVTLCVMGDGPILDFNQIGGVLTGKTNCDVKENWRHVF